MAKPQNKNDNSETLKKVPLTDIIYERLHELQKKYNYTGVEMAQRMDISYDAYRGIVRTGGTKYLKREQIQKLAQHFQCTQDYITGDSQDPNLDKNGRTITHPVSFTDLEYSQKELLEKVIIPLNKSNYYPFLCSLYILFYELSSNDAETIIESINTITKLIKFNTLMMRKDNLTEENLNLISECLKCEDINLTKATIALANADKAYEHKDYQTALSGYLQIIYHTSHQAKPAIEEAVKKVNALHSEMQDFPLNLLELIWEFEKLEENDYWHNTPKANKIIIEYMRQNNIPLMDRNSDFE